MAMGKNDKRLLPVVALLAVIATIHVVVTLRSRPAPLRVISKEEAFRNMVTDPARMAAPAHFVVSDDGKTARIVFDTGVSMKLVLIPSGKFQMGSGVSAEQLAEEYKFVKAKRVANEFPQHEVTISKPFYLGIMEITRAQWYAKMGTEPWNWRSDVAVGEGAQKAASFVSWNDTNSFCKALSGNTGKTVRLPTEAEWEYACRSGTTTRYFFGDDASKLDDYAWCPSREYYAHQVGKKKPSAWGLHDMHGNVQEWCGDWYDSKYYAAADNAINPTGPPTGRNRVLRGGSFRIGGDNYCRSANRQSYSSPDYRDCDVGFRVVVELGSDAD